MSTLHQGTTGNSVIEWQELLIKAGYQLPIYGIDGQFGKETSEATKQFQQDMAITVDGIVGVQTLVAMKVRLGMASPEIIPKTGGQLNLDQLTDGYKEATGSIVAPTQRKFLSIPALGLIAGSLYLAKKKKWF